MSEEKENIKDKYYVMQVACANCGKGNAYDIQEYKLYIPKGVEADTFLEKTPCANCGCHTLARIVNFVFPRLTESKKKKEKKEKEDKDSEEKTNDLNTDVPSIFKKKPKLRVKKIIK